MLYVMNFLRLRHSSHSKEIGKFPQVAKGEIPTTWDDPNYIGSYGLPNDAHKVLTPTGLLLYKKARLTHLLSSAFAGISGNLLISERLKIIIENSRYLGLHFFPTTVRSSEYGDL